MPDALSWYDSVWLQDFFAARNAVRAFAPHREKEFVAAFAALRTDPGFEAKSIKSFADQSFLAKVRETVAALPRESLEMHEVRSFGRFIVHDHPVFTEIQKDLSQRVSEIVQEEVEPSYNFLCMYTQLGVCNMHLDAPSAKWTVDICIDQSETWPIHFSRTVDWPDESSELLPDWEERLKADPALGFKSAVLEPGDAVVFSGSSQWHYRDALRQQTARGFCTLLFLHYIPKGAQELVNLSTAE